MTRDQSRFLIVGGGLAGLLLAWRLRKFQAIVLGGTSIPPASNVSAGVLNPITGGRLTLMEDFDAYASTARELYREIPGGTHHFYEATIRRYFGNDLEKERYEQRRSHPHYLPFLGPLLHPGEPGPAQDDPLGSFLIEGVARVEPIPILATIRKELGDLYRDVDANWDSFEELKSGLALNGIPAKSIISCEGVGVLANPYFRWLPFRPVKGETLTLRSPGTPDFKPILHHGKWIIPLGRSTFRIGSTYQRGTERKEGAEANPSPPVAKPTEEGRKELLDAFNRIFTPPSPPEIHNHRAGTRPCSRDRIPYAGPHPSINNLLLINGMGSKGALLAPLLTQILAIHLTNGNPIPKKISPTRMIHRGFKP